MIEYILGFVALIIIIWAIKSGQKKPLPIELLRTEDKSSSNTEITSNNKSLKEPIELTSSGEFNYDIVGEYYYQKNIKKAFGLNKELAYQRFDALIVHDNNNKHDKNAIAVYGNGYLLGHFSKGKAKSFRKIMRDLGFAGKKATCKARVKGDGTKTRPYQIILDYNPYQMRKKYQ